MSSNAFPQDAAVAIDSLRDLARTAVSARLAAVGRFLALAAEKPEADPEHVHQLRVSSRRATAALRLFRDVLVERDAERMRRVLRQVRRAADAARDDDVLAQRLRSDSGTPGVLRLLQRGAAHRRQAQQPIGALHAELIRSGRYRPMVEQLLGGLENSSHGDVGADVGAWTRKRLKPLVWKFRRASDACGKDAASLHRFRIRTKKLRYSVELLAPALPEVRVGRVARMLERLQDLLGEINDHVVAEARFRRWLDHSDDDEERDYLRANASAERKAFRARRREFRRWWTPRRRRVLKRHLWKLTD